MINITGGRHFDYFKDSRKSQVIGDSRSLVKDRLTPQDHHCNVG